MGANVHPKTGRELKLLLFAISLASFMSALDGSIVNIALPTISEYFDVSTGMVSWVATAYLLVLTSCLLIFGKLGDIRGFKKIFLTGFLVFAIGSCLCGLSGSLEYLIISRIIQAIGGAMIGAIAPAMVATYMPKDLRGKSMGYVTTFASLGVAIGPVLGGFLTEYISWHWIFFINVPVGIFAIMLGKLVIPDTTAHPDENFKFDMAGAALMFMALATGIFVLNMGTALGFTSLPILFAILVCLVSIGVFIHHEKTVQDPLLDLNLFKSRNFRLANAGTFLMMMTFSGAGFLLPFYLEYVKGVSTAMAGMFLIVPSVVMMVAGPVSGGLINKTGTKIICSTAALVSVVGFFIMSGFGADTTLLVIIIALALLGLGLGSFASPNTNQIMDMTAENRRGIVSSLTSTERNGGSVIGIAVFELLFIQTIVSAATRKGITTASPASIKIGLLSQGFETAFFFGMVISILVLITAMMIKKRNVTDNA